MNLLIVCEDFPPNTGGISTYSKEISKALSERCRVIVLALGASKRSVVDSAFPFRVVRTPRFPMLRTTFLFLYLPYLIRLHNIDATIHTVWPTVLASHFWYWLLPVPYFVVAHASEILDDARTWRRRLKGYLRIWRRMALAKAKGIIAISQYTANLLKNLGIEDEHVRVVGNGVDVERFRPATKPKNANMQVKLCTVARLDLHKGHDHVLEALAILKKQGLTPNYTIAGEGEEETRLRKMVQDLGLENQVTFAGFIPDDELPQIYTSSDIFIMPSREIPGRTDIIEGFGISFLEASASGLPVIAGRSGGVPDAVRDGETGILVDPNSPEKIARALKNLISDTALARKLGKQGREWAANEMNWQRVAERLLTAIQDLL